MKHWSLFLRRGVVLTTGLAYGGTACLVVLLLIQQQVLAQVWPWFLITALLSLVFLGTGSVVWLSARQRQVAWHFFAVCVCLAFSLLCALPAGGLAQSISSLGASLGLLWLFLLVLQFPYPLWHSLPAGSRLARLVRAWVAVVVVLNLGADLYCLTNRRFPPPTLFEPFYLGSFLVLLVSILIALIVAARAPLSRRERQQGRLLWVGLGLAFAPWIALTLLPSLLNVLLPLVLLHVALPIMNGLW
ncbi:MAG: hypothetical protein ACRDHW_19610, partial [Ktedonobacteraceae bacterium]